MQYIGKSNKPMLDTSFHGISSIFPGMISSVPVHILVDISYQPIANYIDGIVDFVRKEYQNWINTAASVDTTKCLEQQATIIRQYFSSSNS